jgi:hypothetical protein
MINDFSLRDIIDGCISSKEFSSPECRLLDRIGKGEDLPEYPEYDPEKRYFFQTPDGNTYGPTEIYEYSSIDELLENCVSNFGDYPSDVWEE